VRFILLSFLGRRLLRLRSVVEVDLLNAALEHVRLCEPLALLVFPVSGV